MHRTHKLSIDIHFVIISVSYSLKMNAGMQASIQKSTMEL